ncbi:hypothetical protein OsI_30363 [Oryza sativa Indica Group]|uniref:Uncharacterized protein n=1 Tax=Oryza sativa subsp. indica TaxID=39946 RepID=A2YYD6_ORYSI|nr:hypothetical protein OsI_30363 [Oryza sativa Indica Group]
MAFLIQANTYEELSEQLEQIAITSARPESSESEAPAIRHLDYLVQLVGCLPASHRLQTCSRSIVGEANGRPAGAGDKKKARPEK